MTYLIDLFIWDKSAESKYRQIDAIQIIHWFYGLKTLVDEMELSVDETQIKLLWRLFKILITAEGHFTWGRVKSRYLVTPCDKATNQIKKILAVIHFLVLSNPLSICTWFLTLSSWTCFFPISFLKTLKTLFQTRIQSWKFEKDLILKN